MALWVQVLLIMVGCTIEAIVIVHHCIGAHYNYHDTDYATIIGVGFAGQLYLIDTLDDCHFTLFGKIFICLLYTIFALPSNLIWLVLIILRRLFIKKGT